MRTESYSVSELIDAFLTGDSQPEATDSARGFDKTASAEDAIYEMADEEVQTKLAQADFLDQLADFLENPRNAAALIKHAAQAKGKKGGPNAPGPSGTAVQITEATGDRYNFITGQATQQLKNTGLQRGEAGAPGTHVAVSEAGPDTPLQAPLSKLSERDDIMRFVLDKLGAIDGGTYEGNPNITGQEMKPPEGVMDATQTLRGMQMGEGASQAAGLVASNERAMDFTVRDARRQSVIDLKKMLNERAQSKATDKDLSSNFVNAERAGVKIASSRGSVRSALAHVVAQRGQR